MSSVSKSIEISLDAEDRELLEKAIAKFKKIAHDCSMHVYADECSVFECLINDYNSNGGKLSAYIDYVE